ncbi:hypothetical protein MKQ68_09460 [Chitinophaga horti]|uniref:Alpha-L-rhamnosidase six-hairpin glycosidase domain-containing protein n=1 Tax=Chitinophaga horti TaxID=2920382 RepID=A0ABY6J6S4_9BACT|nr:alpha-L-rhamnosidase C-terminal domain-containing protein [Chitinophaga horti]UYQ95323.1 hypothetical protein MKQ68_09460 [Chitinophaga horti]
MKYTFLVLVLFAFTSTLTAQQVSPLTRSYLAPVKILKQEGRITNPERLLLPGNGQADLSGNPLCFMKPGAYIMLDYGREIHGGLQLVAGASPQNRPVKLRVRFGESVSEAMSEIEPKQNATNDHAMRDMIVEVPSYGKLEVGNTGFRFIRIDVVDEKDQLPLKEARAISVYRDIPYVGSFRCSDEKLNRIWQTAAYTVHLNMQEYLWDGIKRDRLVWLGDMHPEVATINAVFGAHEVVPLSLDLTRDITPLPRYMNGISAYSLWWIIIQRDWYQYSGDKQYLQQQHTYLKELLKHLRTKIGADNQEKLDGTRFLDWPSSEDPQAVHAGLQSLLLMSMDAGAQLAAVLNDPTLASLCQDAAARLRKHTPDHHQSKQAAALLALAKLAPAQKMNTEVLSVGGVKNYSTFYGYYMLQAKALAGDYKGAMNDIRTYWGAMLDLGATTFWEDFNMDWLPNASRIDTFVLPGQKDIHGDYGAYCYKGFRHSLCHGWASGPAPWLTEHVLGITVAAPGCKIIKIKPHLGDLSFAEGTFPTPHGIVRVRHERLANGGIKTTAKGPAGVKLLVD